VKGGDINKDHSSGSLMTKNYRGGGSMYYRKKLHRGEGEPKRKRKGKGRWETYRTKR